MSAVTSLSRPGAVLDTQSSNSMQELRKLGLSNVDYPDNLRGIVERAVASWKDFCSLTREEKGLFAFLEDTHGDGCGYELKEEKGAGKDLKENFHVTLHQSERLEKIALGRSFLFLQDAKNLLDRMEPIILQYAASLEKEFGLKGLEEEVKLSKPYWTLRYLHYFGNQSEGAEIAAPHADKGGFTLHLYESDEGLQYYSLDKPEWNDMPVNEKQTVIIPSMQLQLISKGELKALYHRVVATNQTAHTGRYSMVCFITLENFPKYRKKDFGNMQSHQTAFNYAMPAQEFSQLFS